MKLTKLPLAKWQELLDEFNSTVRHESPAAFRIDGTEFGISIAYGGFMFERKFYTVLPAAEEGAYLAIHPAFSKWLAKRKEPKKKPTPQGEQLTMQLT